MSGRLDGSRVRFHVAAGFAILFFREDIGVESGVYWSEAVAVTFACLL